METNLLGRGGIPDGYDVIVYGIYGQGAGHVLELGLVVHHGDVEAAGEVTDDEVPADDRDGVRLLLNMVALAAEALPRGGYVRIAGTAAAPEVTALGTGAALDAAARAETDGPAAGALSPRAVQARWTRLLAARQGCRLSTEEAAEEAGGGLRFRAGS